MFPEENKGLNLYEMASAEGFKLTSIHIANGYHVTNSCGVSGPAMQVCTKSRNAARQGEGQSEGRNEVLHHEM